MFVFLGDRCGSQNIFITVMRARKWLVSNYTSNLASVVDMITVERDELNDIPMVNEFTRVFPEDLPGLPPDRKVTFKIEVLLGTTPSSKVPY